MKRLLANLPPGTALENMWGVDGISKEQCERQWAKEAEQQVESQRTMEFLQRVKNLQDVRKQGVSEAASPPKRRVTSSGVPVSSLVPDLTPAEVQALRPQQDTSPRHEPPVKPALKQPITSLEERLRRRSRAARMSFHMAPAASLQDQELIKSHRFSLGGEVEDVVGKFPEEPSPFIELPSEPGEPDVQEQHARPPSMKDDIHEPDPGTPNFLTKTPTPPQKPGNRNPSRIRLAESVQKHLERTACRAGMLRRSPASKSCVESQPLEAQPSRHQAAPQPLPESTNLSQIFQQRRSSSGSTISQPHKSKQMSGISVGTAGNRTHGVAFIQSQSPRIYLTPASPPRPYIQEGQDQTPSSVFPSRYLRFSSPARSLASSTTQSLVSKHMTPPKQARVCSIRNSSRWAVKVDMTHSQASSVLTCGRSPHIQSNSAPTSRSCSPFTSRASPMVCRSGVSSFHTALDAERAFREQNQLELSCETAKRLAQFPRVCKTPTTGDDK